MTTEHTAAKQFGRGDDGINRVWKNFRARNAGREAHQQLSTASHGKCYFCERVNAKSIDHYYPKERYPKQMFRWNNLLLCCRDCNNAKGDYFPFQDRRPVLLDPTTDEPLDFFVWDLQTGAMEGVSDPGPGHRATVTRDQLDLDDGPLRDERRVQFNRVLQYLADVCNEHPIRAETRQRLEEELRAERPYLGIIRFLFRAQNKYRPLVNAARAKLPDIDAWVAAWL